MLMAVKVILELKFFLLHQGEILFIKDPRGISNVEKPDTSQTQEICHSAYAPIWIKISGIPFL